MAADIYLEKAKECLASAQSELDNRRYNCNADRSYYARFQVAVYALLSIGVIDAEATNGNMSTLKDSSQQH